MAEQGSLFERVACTGVLRIFEKKNACFFFHDIENLSTIFWRDKTESVDFSVDSGILRLLL